MAGERAAEEVEDAGDGSPRTGPVCRASLTPTRRSTRSETLAQGTNMKQRVAIIGAGPIGLEAALLGVLQGHDVQVYERRGVGSSLVDWGHVKLFSPWAMNVSALGLSVLGGRPPPADEDLATGGQMVEAYFEPLSLTFVVPGQTVVHTVAWKPEELRRFSAEYSYDGKRSTCSRPMRSRKLASLP